MSKAEAISRYSLIINKVRKHPVSFEELKDYLAFESRFQKRDFNISKRTFHRDLNDIRSIYNIDIKYNVSKQGYEIVYEDDVNSTERILEAFDLFNALNLTDRLSSHIHFENRKSKGTENLYGILHAIENRFQLNFTYQGFWADSPANRSVQPLALKEFSNRWYLISIDLKDNNIKSFALDRLTGLEITKTKFNRPVFDVKEYYKHCFGIISPNATRPSKVILSFNPHKGKYIKSLLLHDSQQVLADHEKELRIQLEVFITRDFIMEILSHGEEVKVLEPQSLVDEVKRIYQNALKAY